MLTESDRSFDLFGSRVRILIGAPAVAGARPATLASLELEAMLRGLERELSRFDPGSALSRLNLNPATKVKTSPLVARLVAEAQNAARASGGLVDSAVIGALEQAGYESSRVGAVPMDLGLALADAPSRRPAEAAAGDPWSEVHVDLDRATVVRPPGMKIDSGGLGKGLAADLAAARLRDYTSYAVDCGGDLRIGGVSGQPRSVEVLHPFDPAAAIHLRVESGGVATSGLRSRIWRTADGPSHHLIDPGRGRPAWTGIVQATALAPSAKRAEVAAKTALLGGPRAARRVLAAGGGLLVLDSGQVELIGEVPLESPALAGAE